MPTIKVTGRRARRKAVLSAYNTLVYSLGAYFQSVREHRGLDQEDVASKTGMGQTHVSWIETGAWDHAGEDRVRDYIRAIRLPNESLLMDVLEELDDLHRVLPRSLS